MPNAKLTILSENLKGTSFPLSESENEYSIGRVDSADICIPDPTISSRHCTIYRTEDGELALRDDNSTNGTWLNAEKLENDTRLLHGGDILRFGAIELLYDTDDPQRNQRKHSAVIDLAETGTLRLNDSVLKNLGNQTAAKKSVELRENSKQNMVLYGVLCALGVVVLGIAAYFLLRMKG